MAPIITPAASGPKENFIGLPGIYLGTLLQLQFEGLGSSRSTLIGMEPGKFLVVNTPPIADIGSKLFMKNHGIVRYLSSGNVYAFRCTLLGIIKEPFRMSILSYPDSIENINLRKYERISCILDATISHQEKSFEGIVTDLSIGGCSFDFNKSDLTAFPEIKITDEVSVSMQLKQKGEIRKMQSVVRSMKKDKDTLSLGLQFVPADNAEEKDRAEKELTAYIETMQEGI
jgi:c-di-GMP-binding flagellar brake protein YcgR